MSAAEHQSGRHPDQMLEQELGALRKRFESLREDQVRTEEQLRSLDRQLDELKARAREEYGTDDPEELARILAERRAENQRLVEEYRKHLASIEADLARVEQEAGGGNGNGGQG